MPPISCPACGETESLAGKLLDADEIRVVCEGCGTGWTRSTSRTCGLCGSDQLEYTPRPLWEKGRGDQRTPAGRIDAWSCLQCGGFDVTGTDPRPAPPDVPSRWIRRPGESPA